MTDPRNELIEGQGSAQGGNNNHQLETTLARMADFFEKQGNKESESERDQ